MDNLVFTDTFNKSISPQENGVVLSRRSDKRGHVYERFIPYASIKEVIVQRSSFLKSGFLSLVTLTGGLPYRAPLSSPAEIGDANDDEGTVVFSKADTPQIERIAAAINESRRDVPHKNALIEFWGMSFADSKRKTLCLTEDGISVVYSGGEKLLPYSDIYKVHKEQDCVVVLQKGIDEKVREKEYQKSKAISDADALFSFHSYDTTHLWFNHFCTALDIIMDNKALIPYSRRFKKSDSAIPTDLDGYAFEEYCAELLRRNGFSKVDITPKSGDQGVDILAEKEGVKYAFQCKNHISTLGNTAVQEVLAGKEYYKCHVGVVMTNSTYTKAAIDLAASTGVLLWDGEILKGMRE